MLAIGTRSSFPRFLTVGFVPHRAVAEDNFDAIAPPAVWVCGERKLGFGLRGFFFFFEALVEKVY
jgi:hypothetical protein